jgi:carbon-monoxide dehydrogenase small subunit
LWWRIVGHFDVVSGTGGASADDRGLTRREDARSVRTVEIVATDGEPHPIQRAFSSEHIVRCGFRTPGFRMLAVGAVGADPAMVEDPDRLREPWTPNLCRRTGYEPIGTAVVGATGSVGERT